MISILRRSLIFNKIMNSRQAPKHMYFAGSSYFICKNSFYVWFGFCGISASIISLSYMVYTIFKLSKLLATCICLPVSQKVSLSLSVNSTFFILNVHKIRPTSLYQMYHLLKTHFSHLLFINFYISFSY